MMRMMKIVPASRLVTDASLEPARKPPSIDRSRAITPLGRAVADCASITATAGNPWGPQGCGGNPAYQLFVKIRWPRVVPANEPVKKSSQFPANCDSMEMWAARVLQDHKHGEGWPGPDCGCEPGATVLGPNQSGWLVGARSPCAIGGRVRRDA